MKDALAPGMRDPFRPEDGARRVLKDFFAGVPLQGARVLELGPGHFGFLEAFLREGAVPSAIDFDPVVVQLGKLRGIPVRRLDLSKVVALGEPASYDGLFCKGSINCFWHYGNPDALTASIHEMESCLTPNGWAWVVGCPTPGAAPSLGAAREWLAFERETMVRRGWVAWSVPSRLAGLSYGINYVPPELTLFTRNLPPHRRRSSTTAAMLEWCWRRALRHLRRLSRA